MGDSYRGYSITQEYRFGNRSPLLCQAPPLAFCATVEEVGGGRILLGSAVPQGAYASLRGCWRIRPATPVFTDVSLVQYLFFKELRITTAHITYFPGLIGMAHFFQSYSIRGISLIKCLAAEVGRPGYEPRVSTLRKWNLYPLDQCRLTWFWAEWK